MPPVSPFVEPLHILGSGSLGLFWASSIRSAFPSYPLAALFRPHYKARIGNETKELSICTMGSGRPRMSSVPVQFVGDEKKAEINNLILCTKSYDAVPAVEGILARLRKQRPKIFLLGNASLSVREKVSEVLKHHEIEAPEFVMCHTTHRVHRETPDEDMLHLTHLQNGQTWMEGHPSVAELWGRAGLNTHSIHPLEMEVKLWKYHAIDCLWNPLVVSLQETNGNLERRQNMSKLQQQVVEEVVAVARIQNPNIKDNLTIDDLSGAVEETINERLSQTYVPDWDEVENLNGFIVRKGAEFGIDTPGNQEIQQRAPETVDLS